MSDYNTGNCNTGNCNTGNWNAGDCNTGDWNVGDWNTGNWNVGDYNTGDCNVGDYNIGDWNTGNWNVGDYNTGDCNTNPPTVRIFNKDSGWEFFGANHNKFRNIIYKYSKPLLEWVSKSEMTPQEIKDNPRCETTQGYLKYNGISQKDLEVSKEDEEFLRAVPNFDEKILLETTGIGLSNKKVKLITSVPSIMISKESAEEFKKAFCK